MTLMKIGRGCALVSLLCCACANPFAVDATEPGGPPPGAGATAASKAAVPASGMGMGTATGAATSQPAASKQAQVATGTAAAAAATPAAMSGAAAAEVTPAAAPASAEASPAIPPAAAEGAAATPPTATTPPAAGSEGAAPAEGTPAAAPGETPAASTETAPTSMTVEDGTGRSKGTAPLGTPVPEGGMECPNEVCLPLPALPEQAASMGFMLSLCCMPDGECGTIGSGSMSMSGSMPMCRKIHDSHPECPRLELMGFEVASCCTEDGKCGLNGENFMMKPCGSLEEAQQMFGGFIEIPEPRSCTPIAATPSTGTTPTDGTQPPTMPETPPAM